ncbi:LmeA family phospholipid-binding protein [Nocardia stercoris]|uniref:DUF2993 domain-containing protein n=1 Tax=Nocardia stercoris TaxID=2483361 RepID=A0A3M2L353_9NOCA|nr:DUF2993 domain-containing protein [Nocardia stercoris]RMI32132.1 DUF2993 domain-containing protein [Nocardia stercoris]
MRVILILTVVAAIALIVGDRAGVVLAQNEIGRETAAQYNLPRQPGVAVGGFPFLTQAVDGTYHDVDITVGDWSGKQITVHDLNVKLSDISAPLGDMLQHRTSNIVARTATATALVPYDTVKSFAPAGVESVSSGPDGLHVAGTFPVEGFQVPATVVVTVAPSDQGIEVTPVSARAAAGGPTISLAWLRRTLTFAVPLQQLPLGTRLTAIQPGPDGLQVTAVAHDVRLFDKQ